MKITFANINEVFAQLSKMLDGHNYQIVTTQQSQPTQTQKFQAPNTKLQLGQEGCDNPTWKQINGYQNDDWKWGFSVFETDEGMKRENPFIVFETKKAVITVKQEGFHDQILEIAAI